MHKKILCNKVLKVLLCSALLVIFMNAQFLSAYASSDVVIHCNDVKQTIDGFGVSGAYWSYVPFTLSSSKKDEIFDLLFSKDEGIGLSIVRGEIFPNYSPSEGIFNFNNDYSNQIKYMQEAKKRGVNKFIATTWSPPAWMKSNDKTTNGGHLERKHFQDYANYLADFVKSYKNSHGIDIYAVSIANEPYFPAKWNSCLWTSLKMRDFLKDYLKPVFKEKGLNKTKVIIGEDSAWSEFITLASLNNDEACSRVDIVGAHAYQAIPHKFPTANARGKKTWMTEVCDTKTFKSDMSDGLYWAKSIHKFMTTAEVNAYLYWVGIIDDNSSQGLSIVQNGNIVTAKRLYTMGQYSKFIRPGYERIELSGDAGRKTYFSAYKNSSTNEIVVVAINDTSDNKSVRLRLDKGSIDTAIQYVTDNNSNIKKCGNIKSKNGNININLNPYSVTTFIIQ